MGENAIPLDGAAAERAMFYHGGNLAAARLRFPNAPEPWIDLSTGVNPISYPIGFVEAASWELLPEATEIADLERVAAQTYGVEDPACVVAAPGTQALVQILPWLAPARRVGVLGFTYGEHARCWGRAGASVETIEDLETLDDFDVAVVVNPNNPDGRLVPVRQLQEAARRLGARGGALIVDEAFMDVGPSDASLAPLLPERGAVVLRSFGKTYGLAGLRLGFAIAPVALAGDLRAALGPWAVSGPAIAIGRRALADADWLAVTKRRLGADAARLDSLLQRAGLHPVAGTSLFRLVQHPEAHRIFERLGGRGVLVRAFAEQPNLLRVGLPGPEAEWALLAERLAQVF